MQTALFQYLLRLGDTNLILGHRLSELCSRGPFLEEDIALTNFALDHIGQAEALLKYAGESKAKAVPKTTWLTCVRKSSSATACSWSSRIRISPTSWFASF